MNKLNFMITTLCLLLTSCGSSSASSDISESPPYVELSSDELSSIEKVEPDFRTFCWGDNIDKVLEIQGTPFKNEKDNDGNLTISFPNVKINDVDTILYMCFNEKGQLYSAYYDISVTSLYDFDANNKIKKAAPYYTTYQTLSTALNEKYGEPIESETMFTQPAYETMPKNYGMYLQQGKMSIKSKWETDTTDIILIFTKGNYCIFYFSKEYSKSKSPEIPDIGV